MCKIYSEKSHVLRGQDNIRRYIECGKGVVSIGLGIGPMCRDKM